MILRDGIEPMSRHQPRTRILSTARPPIRGAGPICWPACSTAEGPDPATTVTCGLGYRAAGGRWPPCNRWLWVENSAIDPYASAHHMSRRLLLVVNRVSNTAHARTNCFQFLARSLASASRTTGTYVRTRQASSCESSVTGARPFPSFSNAWRVLRSRAGAGFVPGDVLLLPPELQVAQLLRDAQFFFQRKGEKKGCTWASSFDDRVDRTCRPIAISA
jgi:hypothetical protein